ncbi:hypothetical protein BOTBODRAFT_216612 [Botryobasidium botryosum FD-172 SS1]|uniref:Uncharacterized protein n=1 Tax=Botryobasidium botryosum (strain FD-172 SS1) TaxID=930990 RepID=A0A067NCS0_BOTB1|nr:hypothetical protein BOTBODRAFT_216612 [Botryobasidium botryosum FD-172 SS1]
MCANLGQSAKHAGEILTQQPRHFLFSILMVGRMVHFDTLGQSRGDHSGNLQLREESRVPVLFLWHYAHLDEIRRGYNSTIERTIQEEEQLFSTDNMNLEERYSRDSAERR